MRKNSWNNEIINQKIRNRKGQLRKITAFGLMLFFCTFLLSGCQFGQSDGATNSNITNKNQQAEASKDAEQDAIVAQWEKAKTTPFGRYPETVKYTLGKLTGSNNSNLPDGDTYENNAYTRFLRNLLNVQNYDVFEEMDSQYDSTVSMAIASGDIPDIMIVSSSDDLRLLVENDMIADLSESFDECMSDTIKQIYNTYGSSILDGVTFDGKIMAIPETNIEDGPNLVWLRKDWMDKLGLEDPKTLSDVEDIVREFIIQDPGNNGQGNTIGIVSDPNISGECGYSSEYLLDIVFASYGAFPKQWIYDENRKVVYGSVQPEAKDALAHIHEMYDAGILDHDFLLRTSSNIIDLIVSGQCGSFFGPWWAPNNPLMQAISVDKEAVWMPYLIATEEDGSTSYYSRNPTYKYVVVRKGFEYPELACKIISALFDYGRYEENDNAEFIAYYQDNVDPTARPIAINVDYSNALSLCYAQVSAALNGDKDPEELNLLEYSYYEICDAYLQAGEDASPEEWAAYTSRITACSLLSRGRINKVESLYFGETETMISEWWKLEDMELETYLQIVTGDISIDAFDSFVAEWMSSGGGQIQQEVASQVSK